MATIKVKCIANCYSNTSIFLAKNQEIEVEADLVKEGVAKNYLEVIPSNSTNKKEIVKETVKVEPKEDTTSRNKKSSK